MKAKKEKAKYKRAEQRERMLVSKTYTQEQLAPYTKALFDQTADTVLYCTKAGNWKTEEQYKAMSSEEQDECFVFVNEKAMEAAEAIDNGQLTVDNDMPEAIDNDEAPAEELEKPKKSKPKR
jgi:hypothetical protein